ncbi:unnamed protein product [Penicillium roqueforti FM164]|uniref:Genomic scaffold, ProqFM164S04 n=1 Tax=Penicillium roqueforti (strain FM164) TaxID=1365484 RepID=W6QGE2_PENRF|nr:unnamed protein product [Penicillium roqueforti FM164]
MSPECYWLGRGEGDRSTPQGLQANEGAPVEAPARKPNQIPCRIF